MYLITSKIADMVDYTNDDGAFVQLHSGINEVDDAGLELLTKNAVFQLHLSNGYITIAAGEEPIVDAPKKSKNTEELN